MKVLNPKSNFKVSIDNILNKYKIDDNQQLTTEKVNQKQKPTFVEKTVKKNLEEDLDFFTDIQQKKEKIKPNESMILSSIRSGNEQKMISTSRRASKTALFASNDEFRRFKEKIVQLEVL